MATTQLSLYNGALRLLGESSLASTSEDNLARRTLDEVYDDALVYCLGQGFWNFALRRQELSEDEVVSPTSGYSHAFEKPTDYVRLVAISLSETFIPPLTDYLDKQGHWFTNGTPLYIDYISKDASIGLDLTVWPMEFVRYVETHLAAEICPRLTESASKLELLRKLETKRKTDASAKDAMNESVRFKPQGSWVRSRSGGRIMDQRREDS